MTKKKSKKQPDQKTPLPNKTQRVNKGHNPVNDTPATNTTGKSSPDHENSKTPQPRRFLLWLFLSLAAVAVIITVIFSGGPAKKHSLPTQGYNLLVFTLDTLRADRVGVYGYKEAHTPNIDGLAQQGILMENCYTPAPLTLPAHCSIFTGRYPLSHQARDNGIYELKPEVDTLAEMMKKTNRETYAVISAFVLLGKFGLNQGFDTYDDSLNSHKMYNNYTSEIPADEVYHKFLQWYEGNYHKQFFAWIHLYDPHAPYTPPKKYAAMYKNDFSGQYNGEIAFTDECVGKIIDKLKEKNILDHTLVVLVGDHGEAFGEHEEYGHGIFCYNEVLKVPLIIYNPNLFPRPVRIHQRVNLIDIMPTLLDIFQIPPPSTIQGNSFLPLINGENEDSPRTFFFESMHGQNEMNWAPLLGLIDGRYKYISLPESELYDLEADPAEKENLFWKQNRLAKDLDKQLQKYVTELANPQGDSQRELSEEDKKRLQSLGYVSSFSEKSMVGQDPKKGIVLDNKIKEIFRFFGEEKVNQAETELHILLTEYKDIDLPIFYDLKYQLYIKKNDTEGTLALLKQALEKFAKIERFYLLYAFKLFENGIIPQSETTCRQLLELNPRFTRAYILLGEIAVKRSQIDMAMENYQKALAIEPENISLRLKYAEMLIMKEQYSQALSLYDTLIQRSEVAGNPDLLFKVGLFHSRFGSLEKSIQLLKKAIELDPKCQYNFNYALVVAKSGDLEQALKHMEIALEKTPSELSPNQVQLGRKAIELWKQKVAGQ